jgi:hypothetical protein
MGAPLFANYQSALVYPPNLILYLVGPVWGHGLLAALHLIWAGLGMYFLARRLGVSPLARAVAGMTFSLSGYLVARSSFLSINAAAAWMPWIILAADRLVQLDHDRSNRRKIIQAGCLLSITLALQWLAGHAQTAWYTIVALMVWVLWRLIGNVSFKQALKIFVYIAIAALFAFMLAAVQLLPTIEYTMHSFRVDTLDTEFAMNYSFWPWRILSLVLPGLFGSPASGDFWGYANYWEDAIYFGVLPFFLSLLALVAGWRRKIEQQSAVKFLTILGGAAMLLAMGKNTPIYPFLFKHAPTFNMFQAPTRWNIIFVFAFTLLAAIGLDELKKPTGRALYWSRLGTVGAGIIGLAALAAGQLMGEIEVSFLRTFIIAGIWFVASGLLLLMKPEGSSVRWGLILGSVVLIDLIVASRGLIPAVTQSVITEPGDVLQTIGSDHRVYMDSVVEEEVKFEWTHRFDTYLNTTDWELVREYGLPNTTIMDGIPSANNFDPLLPQRYVMWMNGIELISSAHRVKLLSLMDVRWQAVITSYEEMSLVYEELADPQRVRWVARSVPAVSYLEAFDLVMDPGFDPENVVVLEGDPDPEDETENINGSAKIIETDDPNFVTIASNSPVDGWVVLSDTWFPGWKATVDDQPTEIFPADFLFRAVRVPAGEHQVHFEYQPASFMIGLYLSLLACCLLAIQGWRWWRS